MPLKSLADFRRRLELSRCHDDLRITLGPVFQRSKNSRRSRIVGILHKGHTRPREKAHGLHSIKQHSRVFAQIARRHPHQPHFFVALGANQRPNDVLPLQSNTHPVTAINQKPRALGIWRFEISCRLAPAELHAAGSSFAATRRATI